MKWQNHENSRWAYFTQRFFKSIFIVSSFKKKKKKKSKSDTTQRIDLILSFLAKQPEIFFVRLFTSHGVWRHSLQVPSSRPLPHGCTPCHRPLSLSHCPASLPASRTPACCHIDGALKQRGWQTGWLTSPQMGSLKIPPNIRESCISAINIIV